MDPTKRALDGSNLGLYLFNPAGFYISGQDGPVYESPDYFQFNDLCINSPSGIGPDCYNCCYSSVDFCVPSDSNPITFQDGTQYKLVLATPKTLINPGPSGNGIDLDYVISLGNPFVTLMVNPSRDNLSLGCTGYSWD